MISVAGHGRTKCELRPPYRCQTTLHVISEDNPRSTRGTMQSVQLCVAMTDLMLLMLYTSVKQEHHTFKPLQSCAHNTRHPLSMLNKGKY